MGCGVCRTQLKLEEPIPAVHVVARPADILSQENLDTLTRIGEREVVIQTCLNPDEESLPSDVHKPIDSYGISHSENFGNAREDTEVVLDAPATVRKKPETPELLSDRIPQRPLKPLIPEIKGQPAPKSVFKTSEKPIFELPKIAKNSPDKSKGIMRLPSDLMLVDAQTAADMKPKPEHRKEETLDSLLRDIEFL